MSRSSASQERTEELLKAFHEESALGKVYDRRLIARLWPYIVPHKKLLFLALGGVLITAATSLLRPVVMLHAIDHGVLAGNAGVLLQGGLSLAGLVIVEQILLYVQVYTTQVLGARATSDLRRDVFVFLHRLRIGFFDRQPVGRLVTRVTNDVDAILELFASGALSAVGDLVRLFGIVVLMLILDWQLSLITFAATPVVLLLMVGVRGRMREAFREIRAKTARMNATMNEQVAGMGVTQAFRREARAADEFDDINRAYRDANIASIKYESMQDAAIEMITAVCLASIVVAFGYHRVSFGTVVAFNAYVVQFFEPISALAMRFTLLQSAMAGAERIFGLMDGAGESERDAPPREAAPPGDRELALAFERVTFAYKPGNPVLSEVSFAARRGERIALVGPTGAGKSTVTQLLLRLYEVESGVVRVDGDDVAGLSRAALRRRFAVVPQDVYLFPGTVAANIAAGEEPDRERVRQALTRMGALDLFERRPQGIDTPVDEHGANFSAGERQLIAFARALYRDAPILILDEATANIDSDTEARVQHALEALLEDRTAIVIAHRLSTIRRADRIVVFHKGRVVEQGTHDQLIAQGGLYSRLHELQFARGAASAAE
ncbi:MAG: ABC transporter ATP-binding protein/permease [Polyangiaceae bacterium]|nr:ABC transporter ATP-binding protein/permease [Polyangiaceae bacterium]